jgi:hypothetical protein
MSRQNERSFRGWWCAVLLGVVGCGGPWVEEPPPGDEAQAVPELSVQDEALGTESASQCQPAFRVQQSPVLSPYPFPAVLTPLRGRVYFLAPTTEGGPSALWRSNATGAGTYPIFANASGPLMKAGELLYFVQSGGSPRSPPSPTHSARWSNFAAGSSSTRRTRQEAWSCG